MAALSSLVLNTKEKPSSPTNGLVKEGFLRLNTHDTSFVEGHISTIERFAEDLQEAVNAVWPSRSKKSRYTEVFVILLSWEDDNLGVENEIRRLSQVFSNIYRFEVNEFKIPRKSPGLATISQLSSFLLKAGQDCLLIVYYAGHTRLSQQTNEPPIWTATEKPDSPTLPSGGVQQLVEESELDVLLLYDSCHSSHPAVSVSGQGVTEVIAACGFEAQAPIVGPHSFTNALIRVLEESFATAPFSVADLHSRVIGNLKNWKPALLRDSNGEVWRDEYGRPKYECHKRRTPVHCFLTNETPCRSIMLAPLTIAHVVESATSSNSSTTNLASGESSVTTISTAATEVGEPTETTKSLEILLAIRLEEDYFLDDDDEKKVRTWCEWLRNIPAAAKTVKIQGVYRSCSTLVLLSMPIVVWDLLPDKAGYSFVGFVASDNLAARLLADDKHTARALPTGVQVETPQLSSEEGKFSLDSNKGIQRSTTSTPDKQGWDLLPFSPYNASRNNWGSTVDATTDPTSKLAGKRRQNEVTDEGDINDKDYKYGHNYFPALLYADIYSSDTKYTPPTQQPLNVRAEGQVQNSSGDVRTPGPILSQLTQLYGFAEVCFGDNTVLLVRKLVGRDFDGGRELVAVDRDGSLLFRHQINLRPNESCYPYTPISQLNGSGFGVGFNRAVLMHTIFIEGKSINTVPRYIFKHRQDFIDFQSEVRGEKLEDSFNTQRIVSRKKIETRLQRLNIWRSHVTGDCSVSFYSNNVGNPRDIEIPLRLLEEQLKQTGNLVRMNFLGMALKPLSQYPSPFRQRTSESLTRSSYTTIPRESILSSASSNSSLWTETTATSRSSLSNIDSDTITETLAKEMRYLEITFSDIAEATRFCHIYERIYPEEVNRRADFVSNWQQQTFADYENNTYITKSWTLPEEQEDPELDEVATWF